MEHQLFLVPQLCAGLGIQTGTLALQILDLASLHNAHLVGSVSRRALTNMIRKTEEAQELCQCGHCEVARRGGASWPLGASILLYHLLGFGLGDP